LYKLEEAWDGVVHHPTYIRYSIVSHNHYLVVSRFPKTLK